LRNPSVGGLEILPLQGEDGGVFEKQLKPPLPLLAKEGIKPVT